MKRGKTLHRPVEVPWTPFVRGHLLKGALNQELAVPAPWKFYYNSRYTVFLRPLVAEGFLPYEEKTTIVHLSIRRLDKDVVRDWRELQRIKNELVGEEREAVELYTKESRKLDDANHFHLYVMPEGYTFPFGSPDRWVSDDLLLRPSEDWHAKNSGQRPFDLKDPYNEPSLPSDEA